MNRVFVDTSALIALLSSTDDAHARATRRFQELRSEQAALVTSSYVMVETYAVIDRRFGRSAVAAFREDFAGLLKVIWIGQELHDRGLDLLLSNRARLSLVDAVSLLLIREAGIDAVFAFDPHLQRA